MERGKEIVGMEETQKGARGGHYQMGSQQPRNESGGRGLKRGKSSAKRVP